MKIGKAKPDLERRLYQIFHTDYYQSLNLEFRFALVGVKYESQLHSLFSEYRANIKWLETGEHFTEAEAWKLALDLHKQKTGSSKNELKVLDIYRQNTITTRNEVFHLPPRKIGKHVESLVLNELFNQ